VCFILAALRELGPYPVLDLIGEHGAAKSTFANVLRKLIDPNSAALRALPREDRDLFIAAVNAHLLVFDNISKMPDWISDTLCRLATGGGFATRQLYSDQDEALFDAMRPIILNGIEDFVSRPDLADRTIFLNLKNIDEDKRKSAISVWADFECAHPRILGAVLDGVAHGLRQLPNTSLKTMPRMADFALWATACEQAFWEAGTFAKAYEQNRDDAVQTVIEADLVATAVQSFMAARTVWRGTAADLLGALKMAVTEDQTKLREWPSTPRSLSGRVRLAAATLRKIGIDITFEREGHGHGRVIRIVSGSRHPPAGASSEGGGKDRPHRPHRPHTNDINDLDADGRLDVPSASSTATVRTSDGTDDADGMGDLADGRPDGTVRTNPLKNKAADGADGADAKKPALTVDGDGGVSNRSQRWPGLSPRVVSDLADEFSRLETGSATELDGAIRARLAKNGVPAEAIDVEVERVVRRIDELRDAGVVNPTVHAARTSSQPAHGPAPGDAEPAPYKVLGPAGLGGRCLSCGSGVGAKKVLLNGKVEIWHPSCVERHLTAMANPPVTLPDLGPDHLDEHGAPRTAASMPFMVTQDMKHRLRTLGYSDEQIAHLKPKQAHDILAQEVRSPNT
jgi:hypothetical protein